MSNNVYPTTPKAFSKASTRLQTEINQIVAIACGNDFSLSKTQANEILSKVLGSKNYNEHLALLEPSKSPLRENWGVQPVAESARQPETVATRTTGLEIIAEVSCLNQWCDDAPRLMHVQMPPLMVESILKAQKSCIANPDISSVNLMLFNATFHDGSDDYYEFPAFQPMIELGECEPKDAFQQYLKTINDADQVSMEQAYVEVTARDFRMFAVMNGASDDFECSASTISIELLASANRLLSFSDCISGSETIVCD